jgi:hypothetical protein
MLQPKTWLSTSNPKSNAARLRLSAAHSEWNHVGSALAAMEEGFFADEGLSGWISKGIDPEIKGDTT